MFLFMVVIGIMDSLIEIGLKLLNVIEILNFVRFFTYFLIVCHVLLLARVHL